MEQNAPFMLIEFGHDQSERHIINEATPRLGHYAEDSMAPGSQTTKFIERDAGLLDGVVEVDETYMGVWKGTNTRIRN